MPTKLLESKMVHFSVTGEFITRQARELWQEYSFNKALDVLGCLVGSTRDQHEEILMGSKKLTGVNEVLLEPDDWKPPKGYCTFREAMERGESYFELKRLKEDTAYAMLDKAVELTLRATGLAVAEGGEFKRQADRILGLEESSEIFRNKLAYRQEELDELDELDELREQSGGEARSVAEIHKDVHGSVEPADSPKDDDPIGRAVVSAATKKFIRDFTLREAAKREGITIDTDAIPNFDAMFNRGMNLVPTLCKDMSSASGWLLTDGKYYGCSSMEHIGLAENLLEQMKIKSDRDSEKTAEGLGWVKISRGMMGLHVISMKKPTKKQIDKLHVYCDYHKLKFEDISHWLGK